MAKASAIPADATRLEHRLDNLLINRGVGRRHAGFRPGGLGSPWARKFNGLLERTGTDGFLAVLLGCPGVGKTQMAVEWLRFVLASTPRLKNQDGSERNEPVWLASHVLYRKASTLFREIRETFNRNDKCEQEVVKRLCTVRALVVDEIDVRARTEFEQRMLRDILDERYGNLRETVIISNDRNRHLFLEHQHEYLVSRLSESGLFIECNWPSFREK